MFVDEATITVSAGKGGPGMTTFRREKYVAFGGPAGGDGGRGGDIVLVATHNAHTLSDYRFKVHIRAENGKSGGRNKMTGRDGQSKEAMVPVGTLVFDMETGELLADMTEVGQRVVVAKGGDGGKGNARFKTSTNKAPKKSTPGWPGEERGLRLELKLIADVALVGYPSVGKSTLISVLSNARPKIAAYHFTTLAPNLGVVPYQDYSDYVIADVPGLIEGAHEGQGLGIQFLKHIERTRVIAHIVEVSLDPERSPAKDFDKIRNELSTFEPRLLERPQVVVLNKTDVINDEKIAELRAYFEGEGFPFIAVSAVTTDGIDALRYFLGDQVKNAPEPDWLFSMPQSEE